MALSELERAIESRNLESVEFQILVYMVQCCIAWHFYREFQAAEIFALTLHSKGCSWSSQLKQSEKPLSSG